MPCTVFRIAAAAATATGRRALAAIAACMGAVVTNSPHGPRAGRAVLALPVGQGESGRARVKRSLTASACRAYCAPCRAGGLRRRPLTLDSAAGTMHGRCQQSQQSQQSCSRHDARGVCGAGPFPPLRRTHQYSNSECAAWQASPSGHGSRCGVERIREGSAATWEVGSTAAPPAAAGGRCSQRGASLERAGGCARRGHVCVPLTRLAKGHATAL